MRTLTFLLLGVVFITSCKQKSSLYERKKQLQNPNSVNIEERLNYSPDVKYISMYGDIENNGQGSGPDDITVYLNKDNVLGNHKLIIESEEDDIDFTDLEDNPASFDVPELDELCGTTNSETAFAAHQYHSEVEEASIYAFSVLGQCDGVETRCALIYMVPDDIMTQSMMIDYPLFDHPFLMAQTMGLDGQHSNCEVLFDKAFPLYGCMDSLASNYDEEANREANHTCVYPSIEGCMDMNAVNYDSNAEVDDGSCGPCNPGFTLNNGICEIDAPAVCDDPNASNDGQAGACLCNEGYTLNNGVCEMDNCIEGYELNEQTMQCELIEETSCQSDPIYGSLACEELCNSLILDPSDQALCGSLGYGLP